MKKINVFLKISVLVFAIAIFSGIVSANSSYAVTDNTGKWLQLYQKSNGRKTGFYSVDTETTKKPVIKIVETNSTGTTEKDYNNMIYCLRNGIGFGSEGSTSSLVHYTQYFDLSKPSEIPQLYRNALPTDKATYNKMFTVALYISNPSDDNERNWLLSKAGLASDAFDNYVVNGQSNEDVRNDIIEAVQQAALWHFAYTENQYKTKTPSDSEIVNFYFSRTNGGTEVNLDTLNTDGDLLSSPINTLYKFFIDKANEMVDQNGFDCEETVHIVADQYQFDKSEAKVTYKGGSYLIGPYTFVQPFSGYLENFDATITDGTNPLTNYKVLKSDKTTEANGLTFKDKIESLGTGENQFYIEVPFSTSATKIQFSLENSYMERTIKYWTTAANEVNTNQPVLIISNETIKQKDSDTKQLVKPEFDLALRKFITKINGQDVTVSREPSITHEDLVALKDENPNGTVDGEGKTTFKRHTKNPLEVRTGDVVTYTIRIYNEGYLDGAALKIADYIPDGLELTENSEINTKYNWVKTADKKYETEYLKNVVIPGFNKVEETGSSGGIPVGFMNTNTKKYAVIASGGSANEGYEIDELVHKVDDEIDLYYADVEVECTVKATITENDLHLKNVAEITNSANEYGIADRDSITNNIKQNQLFENYNAEKSTLGMGYEDDDDYEDLVLPGTYFDLALRKYITSIDGVAPAVSRKPSITQENLRKLANSTSPLDNGKTAVKPHTKDPLEVKYGSTVVYTIEVYNEGKVDGKATKIVDYLPEGLKLKENSTTNTNYGWTVDPNDSRKVETTYLKDVNLKAFSLDQNGNSYKLSSAVVMIECEVESTARNKSHLKNVAEITEATNELGLTDRDSVPNTITEEQRNNYSVSTSEQGKGYQDDDDYEDLYVREKEFDLALRKFITKVNGENVRTSRVPAITQEDLRALFNKDASKTFDNGTTSYKNHTKTPVKVKTGDKVTYTIRIYNEGEIDGKATEIVDYLPEGLKLSENSEINSRYGWTASATNPQEVKTTYLRDANIKAFNTETTDGRYVLDYKDVEIECDVVASGLTVTSLKNVAEITDYYNEENLKDRDSTENNVEHKGNDYNPGTSPRGKGYEDDDDYEELLLQRFDLALRKFITGVNEEQITNRIPEVDKSKFGTIVDGKLVTTCTYNHTKEPVRVAHDDIVFYTIRVYNEGNTDGYASIVKDDLPEGLLFLPEHATNTQYRWVMYDKDNNITTDVTKADYIQTDYLSKEQERTSGANLLKAFDPATMESPDYRDVVIAFKVTEPNTSDRIIINKAQIKRHKDKENEDVDDIDSTPDKWIEGEDDQDIEKIYVKYFDLALRKWVTQAIVIEDGKEKVMNTGHKAEDDPESVVKVEVNKKRLNNTVIKFKYSIRITNEGEIEGHCLEISDYIPHGLKFNQADNPQWKEVEGKVTTDQLKDRLLQPGESAEVEILLTWVNDENNMGVMINTAEISEDDNDDIDSTPNNKKEGEDDIDTAPVALTVSTGKAQTFVAIASVVLLVVGTGVYFIKKFVI